MFASTSSAVTAQVALFKQAMANYTAGPIYLTMGNHECTGATASNCPNLTETPNIQAFMADGAGGRDQAVLPHRRRDAARQGQVPLRRRQRLGLDAAVVAAAAARRSDDLHLRRAPRVDDVVGRAHRRHASESIVGAHPYTLELLGHTHEYRHEDTKHVISGNAGAPLSTGNYGLLIVEQKSDGNITVTEIDEATGSVTDTWTVSPTGQKI